MRCPHCGPIAQPRTDDIFCSSCGVRLVTSAAQSAVDAVGDAERERPASSSIGKPRQTVDSIGEMLGCPRRQIIPINQSPSPGTDYHLIEEIGIGGMGVIYAAQQMAVHRQVALKRMQQVAHGAPGDDAGFFLEAMITAKLDHPNIIPIHDMGIDQNGLLFYTMRKVNGRPWSKSLMALSLEDNLDILQHVCDAIAYAHSKDLIHRDLKPENILLGNFGEVLVTDWGLAVEVSTLRSSIATTRVSCGTPAYMAPEMAWDDRRAIGKRSDIYLLGAILYEILTGLPPHPGSTVRASIEAAGANIIDPACPVSELGGIAQRAMATMPEDRFGDVRAFHLAIVACRTHIQSERLVDCAERHAAQASLKEGYTSMASAVHAFEEALVLWPDNPRAAAGLEKVRNSYAGMALVAGDLDLAASLATGARPDDQNLRARIASARERRRLHATRARMLAWSSVGLLALLFAVLAGSLIISVHEREKVVLAMRDRDRAEAQLAHEEGLRLHQERRIWEPLLREDFNTGALPAEIKVVSGTWSIEHGQLLATSVAPVTLMLTVDASGDVRIRLDRASSHAVRMYLGVSRAEVADRLEMADVPSVLIDRQCHILRGGRELGVVDMPESVAGLNQRITVERDSSMIHVLVEGHQLLSADIGDWKNPGDARLVISAAQGLVLEDLRVECLRIQTAGTAEDSPTASR
jgi:serine/threonine protein kinase